MNDKKICFITCFNDEVLYNECVMYINNLNIPQGFEVEVIGILDAKSMASGYNEAMQSSDAKYKVYLHQDVFIINKNFIYDIINIFNSDSQIGLIGVIEQIVIPRNGMWWQSYERRGQIYSNQFSFNMSLLKFSNTNKNYEDVSVVEGSIMVTQYDIKWREDILCGWDMYDVCHSFEFVKANYKVVIPQQEDTWCIHDCGKFKISHDYHINLDSIINEYRQIIIKILNYSINNKIALSDRVIVVWRNIIYEKLYNQNINLYFVDKYLSKKYNIINEDSNGLFDFDKYMALQFVLENRDEFNRKINDAKRCLLHSDYENVIKFIFAAGEIAYSYHPGIYVSGEAESMLLECAKILPEVQIKINSINKNVNIRKVLHILSEGYAIGGHTRLANNWIIKDANSVHSIVTTWQSDTLPEWIRDSVIQSGGTIYSLDKFSESYLDRAAILRKIAYEQADIVVLHMHMYDPIPVMAFGVDGGPPVVYMNHADHCFWLGASIIDIEADFREAGQKLAIRRGVNKSAFLPLPVQYRCNNLSKNEAKKKLGFSGDTKIILSIASEWKFSSFNKYHYLNILTDILNDNEDTVAIIIGPENKGIWKDAFQKTQGRILPLGIVNEIDIYYCAADVYVDSYMISSFTSVIDAILNGVPVALLKNYNNETLSTIDIAFQNENNIYSKYDLYVNYINKLLKDNKFRLEESYKYTQKIKKYHVDLWLEYLENLYLEAENTRHEIKLISNSEEIVEDCDLFLSLVNRK